MEKDVKDHDRSKPHHDIDISKRRKLSGKVLHRIKEQMEFYFSPANLRRDRFLGNLVRSNNDGYVLLDIFLTFNRIQKLTNNINDIIKAVSESSELEISSDNRKIRAKDNVEQISESDDCIIYVERLPQNSNHQYVRNIFNRFGHITYVSLPRYRNSEKIKGFAFVEFAEPANAKTACEAYKTSNDSDVESEDALVDETKRKLNLSKKKPTDFSLTKSKEAFAPKILKKRKRSENEKSTDKFAKSTSVSKEDIESTENEEAYNQSKSLNKKHRKHKRCNSESEVIEKKRRKLLSESESDDLSKDLKNDQCKKRTHSESTTVIVTENNLGNESFKHKENEIIATKKQKLEDEHGVSMKEKDENCEMKMEVKDEEDKGENKKKKRKKKKKETEKLKLRVLSKSDWKYYKNKYLAMQKKSMSSIKKLLLLTKKQQAECEAMLSKSDEQMSESAMNETVKETPEVSITKNEFQPGVIVKLQMKEVVDVPSDFIKTIKSKVDVAFVDVCDKNEAFIRFSDSAATMEAIKSDILKPFGVAELVTGAEEIAYWEKLWKDRETQINRPRTNKRGRDKILAKANTLKKQSTHIYFDDSF